MMKKIAMLTLVLMMASAIPAWAICGPVDHWIDEQAASKTYPVKVGGMILRGLHRIIESPLELVYHTYDGSVNHLENGVGILKGLGSGFAWTLDSIVRGGWDVLTALFPDYYGETGTHELEWGSKE